MRLWARLLVPVTLVVAVACKDSSGPARPPSRADLNGIYQCERVDAYYYNPTTRVAQWRYGDCAAYISVTNPSRADSIDTMAFAIRPNNSVQRFVEVVNGTAQYDSTSGMLYILYPDRPTDSMRAGNERLVQRYPPFDFTGDGRTDSLVITFLRTVRG